jgi:hypothetical protein
VIVRQRALTWPAARKPAMRGTRWRCCACPAAPASSAVRPGRHALLSSPSRAPVNLRRSLRWRTFRCSWPSRPRPAKKVRASPSPEHPGRPHLRSGCLCGCLSRARTDPCSASTTIIITRTSLPAREGRAVPSRG